MSRGLRVPVAAVSGQNEGLPALSSRASETDVVVTGTVAGGAVSESLVAGGTYELSIINMGAAPALALFIATDSPPELGADKAVLLASKGFQRLVPAKGQIVEIRACAAGDTVLVSCDAEVIVRVHDHTGAV